MEKTRKTQLAATAFFVSVIVIAFGVGGPWGAGPFVLLGVLLLALAIGLLLSVEPGLLQDIARGLRLPVTLALLLLVGIFLAARWLIPEKERINTRTLVEALGHLPDGTVVDGEVVALDETGRPNFNLLQNFRSKAQHIPYFVFDLLVFNDRDIESYTLR